MDLQLQTIMTLYQQKIINSQEMYDSIECMNGFV